MKILVVEDEGKIASAIKKGLKQERYAVDVALNGGDGFDLATTEDYDMILLDVLLPDMDGVSLCAKLREKHIHTPILMLTAKGQIRDRVVGLDAGADDYLTKPFSFEELLARIRALSRRPKSAVGTILKIRDLTLDPQKFLVRRGSISIPLSGKEFSLLSYLMHHPNQILSKDQIISHVWDFDADILPNTVEVYMKNLRRKIDASFPKTKALIQTIRGFGYQIG